MTNENTTSNRRPAPLTLLKLKLRSPSATVRCVALAHVAAHREAARPLAVQVARLLDDSDSSVQAEALKTFEAIALGATDAIATLLALRNLAGAPDALVKRATEALGAIGPAAMGVAPMLLQLAKEDLTSGHEALYALLGIAPNDPEVVAMLSDATFTTDWRRMRLAERAVKSESSKLIDALTQTARARLHSPLPQARAAAFQLAALLAPHRPFLVTRMIEQTLERLDGRDLAAAVRAAASLPFALQTSLVEALIRVGQGDDAPAAEALCTLARQPDRRADVGPMLVDAIRRRLDVRPVSGKEGLAAQSFAELAEAVGDDERREVVPMLRGWLYDAIREHKDRTHWPVVLRVLTAAVQLHPYPLDWSHTVPIIARQTRGMVALEPQLRELRRVLLALNCASVVKLSWPEADDRPATVEGLPVLAAEEEVSHDF